MRLTASPFLPHLVVIASVCAIALGGCGRDDPAALMSSAKEYISKNDYNAAAIQVKNVLLKDPQNSEARYLLGVALLNSGSAVAGEIELRKALDAGLISDDIYLQLAQALLDQGANDKLIVELNQRVLSSPVAQAELRATIGYAMLNLGKVNEAREAFDAALNGDPKNASARLGQARLAAAYKRDLDAALKLTEEVLIDYPRHYRATLLKGDILSTQGDRAGAEAAYREAIATAPTNIPPRMNLIGLLVGSKDFEKASAEVEVLAKVAPRDPRTDYAKALVLVVQKKFPDAKESILQVLKVAPDHTPTLLLAGIIAHELRAYSEAEGHLRKVVDQAPNVLLPRRLLAATRLRNGQIERALSDVHAMLRRAPDDPDVLALAGEAYLANGDVVRASQYYERVNSLRPESTAARTRLGQIRLATGDTDRAVQDLEAASAGNPAPSQADFSLITTFLRQKQFDKALEAALLLEKKQPDNASTQNLKGIVYSAKGDLKAARSSFERAVAIFPDYVPALINLARLDLQDNNAESAKKRFEAILKKDPNNVQALLGNATLLRATGAPADEIVKQLQKAVSANPTAPAARLALVNHYLLARDNKAALSAAQNAQAALPDNPWILDAVGTTQIVTGDSRQAVNTYAKLAKLAPSSAEPLVKQASAQVAAGDADGAIQSLRKALTLKPDLALVQQHITSIYVRSGRVKEAIQEARDLQQKQPNSPLGFILEGDIYVVQKKWGAAEVAFRTALKKFELPILITRVHAAMEAGGKRSEADSMAEDWVKEHPKDAFVLGYLADRDLVAKRYDSAAKRYRIALERHPDNPVFLNNLAWVINELKQPNALDYAERAHELAPESPAIMDTLGWLLVDHGQGDRGLELLGRASELAPNAHAIRLHFAKALIKANRKDAARKELEALVKLDARLPVQKEAATLLEKL